MTWRDRVQYRGEWVDGVQHGKGSMHDENGREVKSGNYENNVFTG
jgi:hypothetical protein